MDKVIDIRDELSKNFIDFSYEANSQRAFADARDGLKPGQRACLWEMYINGYSSNKPHVKSAKIDGGVVAKWWPHGTQAIYDTFARMSQPWINNIPEVDWHGGNGSIVISGEASADRYTEARLSKASEDGLLSGIKKNTVKMQKNFSKDAEWPTVFPALMPRLMINGCMGIGSTIANVWLPHRLGDITSLIKEYITTGQLDYSNLAPDFPTGGLIINRNDLSAIYETGRGKAILRAKATIEGNRILITELPYQVYIEPLIKKVKELMKDDTLDIVDIANKTDKKQLLIEIECNGNPTKTLEDLYRMTDLQKTYNANQWALVSKTPKLLNLKEYIDIYISHNISCIKNECEYDAEKAKARLEVVQGLIRALEDIDNIISLIRQSEEDEDIINTLTSKYQYTRNQADAIVNMKLGKLAHLEKVKLNQEQEDLIAKLKALEAILANPQEELIKRLEDFTKKYDSPRHTEVIQLDIPKQAKERPVVEPKDCVVIISKKGVVKRVDAKNFKPQKRNTVGVKNHGDVVIFSQKTNTQDYLMVFTTKGKMYRLLVDTLPEGNNASVGPQLTAIIEFEKGELPIAFTTLTRDTTNKFIFFATKKGMVKKVPLEEYDNVKRTGVVAIKLKDGDSVASVRLINQEQVVMMTRGGYGIRYDTASMTVSSRTAQGVKGITVAEDDEVIAAEPIPTGAEYLSIVSSDGCGKRVALKEVLPQNRGGKGLIYSKDSKIAGFAITSVDDELLINGDTSSLVVTNNDLPVTSRNSKGNILIKGNTSIVSISKL